MRYEDEDEGGFEVSEMAGGREGGEAREVDAGEYDVRESDVREDERLRSLLVDAAPEFDVTSALGDRALAGAARRRTRVRVFGGTGAVAVLAVGVLAIAPLAGWGGHGSHATVVAGGGPRAEAPTTSPTPSPGPLPSSSGPAHIAPPQSGPTSKVVIPAWVNGPKMKALDRVMNALQSGHDNSFMGAGLTGQNYIDDTQDAMAKSATDWSPIVVYRKPVSDPTLEHDATHAAAPYTVVFRDTVLNASEQWFLGHRLYQDENYWKGRGVQFLTSLQENGTITISTPDPDTTLPLLEQHYGYDGRVFVGKKWSFPLPGTTITETPR